MKNNKEFLNDPHLIIELMKNISEGIYLIRLDNNTIVYANERFERMFGYDHGEMIGKEVSMVNAPTYKTPEETKEDIEDVLIKNGEWHGEVKNIKKDGTHFWCYANVSLFEYPKYGKVILSVHKDITEQKKIENDNKKHMDELEKVNKLMVDRELKMMKLKKELRLEKKKNLRNQKKANK